MKQIIAALAALLVFSHSAQAQHTWVDSTLGGYPAFLITPTNPAPGNPWIAYAPTLANDGGDIDLPSPPGAGGEPGYFTAYLDAGIAIAGIAPGLGGAGDLMGNPAHRAAYTLLYDDLVGNRGYAPKFSFHARSRGGLLAYNWAADNPGKVAAIGGLFPVGDYLSYPGAGFAAGLYGVTEQEFTNNLALYNPIERLEPLFNSGVKLFHIHGDSDAVVPLVDNSQIVKDRYDVLGGTMTLTVVAGAGHGDHNDFYNSQPFTDFMTSETLAAALPVGPTVQLDGGTTVSVLEHQPIGTVVGTLSTINTPSWTVTNFVFAGGTDDASFSIDGTSLKTAEIFDSETKSSYSIDVSATNNLGESTATNTFTISVPEPVVQLDGGTTGSVLEHQDIGTVVGGIGTLNTDGWAATNLALVEVDDHASFTIGGTNLLTAAIFDSETKSSYSIDVKADDGAGTATTNTFTITIDPVAEPVDRMFANAEVKSTTTLAATLEAMAGGVTYDITPGEHHAGLFEILNTDELHLKTAATAGQVGDEYFVEVTASGGGVSDSMLIKVTVVSGAPKGMVFIFR